MRKNLWIGKIKMFIKKNKYFDNGLHKNGVLVKQDGYRLDTLRLLVEGICCR